MPQNPQQPQEPAAQPAAQAPAQAAPAQAPAQTASQPPAQYRPGPGGTGQFKGTPQSQSDIVQGQFQTMKGKETAQQAFQPVEPEPLSASDQKMSDIEKMYQDILGSHDIAKQQALELGQANMAYGQARSDAVSGKMAGGVGSFQQSGQRQAQIAGMQQQQKTGMGYDAQKRQLELGMLDTKLNELNRQEGRGWEKDDAKEARQQYLADRTHAEEKDMTAYYLDQYNTAIANGDPDAAMWIDQAQAQGVTGLDSLYAAEQDKRDKKREDWMENNALMATSTSFGGQEYDTDQNLYEFGPGNNMSVGEWNELANKPGPIKDLANKYDIDMSDPAASFENLVSTIGANGLDNSEEYGELWDLVGTLGSGLSDGEKLGLMKSILEQGGHSYDSQHMAHMYNTHGEGAGGWGQANDLSAADVASMSGGILGGNDE